MKIWKTDIINARQGICPNSALSVQFSGMLRKHEMNDNCLQPRCCATNNPIKETEVVPATSVRFTVEILTF